MFKKQLLLSLMILTIGCAANRIDLGDSGEITMKVIKPEGVVIDVEAYLVDDDFVVNGSVHRGSMNSRGIPGHVDIRVLSSTNEEIANLKTQLKSIPGSRPRSEPIWFRCVLPKVPPRGSTIFVTYDTTSHR